VRRTAPSLSVALLLGLPLLALPATAGSTTRAGLQVTQVEYRLLLSSTVVKAGRVDLRELDRGREQHDLRLRLASGGGEVRGKLLRPGTSWEGVVYLRPGTYRLWCSLPEHAKHGMRAVLQVVR
jgi:hypothetical protein